MEDRLVSGTNFMPEDLTAGALISRHLLRRWINDGFST
jgi:hypothetical protein